MFSPAAANLRRKFAVKIEKATEQENLEGYYEQNKRDHSEIQQDLESRAL